jgi:hypothetical protein
LALQRQLAFALVSARLLEAYERLRAEEERAASIEKQQRVTPTSDAVVQPESPSSGSERDEEDAVIVNPFSTRRRSSIVTTHGKLSVVAQPSGMRESITAYRASVVSLPHTTEPAVIAPPTESTLPDINRQHGWMIAAWRKQSLFGGDAGFNRSLGDDGHEHTAVTSISTLPAAHTPRAAGKRVWQHATKKILQQRSIAAAFGNLKSGARSQPSSEGALVSADAAGKGNARASGTSPVAPKSSVALPSFIPSDRSSVLAGATGHSRPKLSPIAGAVRRSIVALPLSLPRLSVLLAARPSLAVPLTPAAPASIQRRVSTPPSSEEDSSSGEDVRSKPIGPLSRSQYMPTGSIDARAGAAAAPSAGGARMLLTRFDSMPVGSAARSGATRAGRASLVPLFAATGVASAGQHLDIEDLDECDHSDE